MDRHKASYEEAVKTVCINYFFCSIEKNTHKEINFFLYYIILKLESKTKCYDSIMMNLSLQNDSNLKNIEDSLSSAIKSKNELLINLLKKIPLEDN